MFSVSELTREGIMFEYGYYFSFILFANIITV